MKCINIKYDIFWGIYEQMCKIVNYFRRCVHGMLNKTKYRPYLYQK